MSKLVPLKHLCFDQRLQGIYLSIGLALNQFDFSECSFTNDLDGLEVRGRFPRANEAKELGFFLCKALRFLPFASFGDARILEDLVEVCSPIIISRRNGLYSRSRVGAYRRLRSRARSMFSWKKTLTNSLAALPRFCTFSEYFSGFLSNSSSSPCWLGLREGIGGARWLVGWPGAGEPAVRGR